MDKKAHVYASSLISNCFEHSELENYKKTIILGNLFPDLIPSFISERHNIEQTFEKFENITDKIKTDFEEFNKKIVFYLGEISHYTSDYFTFPHNPELWDGNIIQHISYEYKQHIYLKEYIYNQYYLEDLKTFDFKKVDTVKELLDEIIRIHNIYLEIEVSIKNDCKFIICMIIFILNWFFYKVLNIEIPKKIKLECLA